MTTLFKDVIQGQRCAFYMISQRQEKEIIMFRAKFIDIINTTLRVNNVECEQNTSFHNCGMMTIPLDWIAKIETLDNNVLENNVLENTLLPSEIMFEIIQS
jgi:hypothetical protein